MRGYLGEPGSQMGMYLPLKEEPTEHGVACHLNQAIGRDDMKTHNNYTVYK
jgi:hypothetical protein